MSRSRVQFLLVSILLLLIIVGSPGRVPLDSRSSPGSLVPGNPGESSGKCVIHRDLVGLILVIPGTGIGNLSGSWLKHESHQNPVGSYQE
jgi:hypothetical protein